MERAAAGVAEHHTEAHPLPGRDLSGVIRGSVDPGSVAAPLYFMTEDDISRGLSAQSILTGKPYDPVSLPSRVETVIAHMPNSEGGPAELWKLNHYYERLDEWNADHGIARNPSAGPPAEALYEMHNLTADPEERHNRVSDAPDALSRMQSILHTEREAKRLLPSHRNPAA